MYIIDLNDPEQVTMANVRKMIASVDDSKDSQIRVSKDGHLYIEQGVVGDQRIEGVLFHSEETLCAGNSYVGPEAAEDSVWMGEVYEDVKKLQRAYEDIKSNWPKPTIGLLYGATTPYALWPMVEGYEGPYANWTELAKGYGGQKLYVELPTPDKDGVVDITKRKVHLF